jgi:hypothetical protein
MGKNGMQLTPDKPKYGNHPLVSDNEKNKIRNEKLIFSFLYYKQIDLFGIGNCSQNWHVGLINRLSSLGQMTGQDVLEENRGSGSLRCHPIIWVDNKNKKKNAPIKRSDLNWLPSEILDNVGEFPIMQFSISTGTGRIIGFFDKDTSVFHIILLDPNHNIQPSKKTNYTLQPTNIGISQYDDLLTKLSKFESVVKKCKYESKCIIQNPLSSVKEEHNVVYVCLDEDFYSAHQKLLENLTIDEILEAGILSLTQ